MKNNIKQTKNLVWMTIVLCLVYTGPLFSQVSGASSRDRAQGLVDEALGGTSQPSVPGQTTGKISIQPAKTPNPVKTVMPVRHPPLPSLPTLSGPPEPQPPDYPAEISVQSPAPEIAFHWTVDMYATYDYTSFEKLPAANQRLDFNHIDYPLLHAAIFYETNRQRVANGQGQFKHSFCLERAAKGHSDDMVKYNFFSHTSVVKGKESMVQRLEQVGIANCYMGENIADTFGLEYIAGTPVFTPEQNGGYFSYKYKGEPILNHTYLSYAQSVLDVWMHSPGHKANILNSHFTYLGTGASHYQQKSFHNMDYIKATQNFSDIPGSCNR